MGNLRKLPTGSKTVKTMNAPTARQNLLSRPDEDEEERWYKGDIPTASEMAARITKIGKSDPARGEQLWSAFSHYYQNDASSPIYNPYTRATNSAVAGIAGLGVDVSKGIDDEWFVTNAGLKNYYRTGAAGTPLSPSGSSSAEQDAGYYYYQILNNEERTKQAEAEWSALQEELTYWAGRKDRNYSDDEIISRIDWNNYPTLTAMDEGREKGVPLKLNRAVGYSKDAMTGVLWAARNDGGTGDSFLDAIHAALGEGNVWQEDKEISARLDPTDPAYNPYAAGSTLDDAALYFGVDQFGASWLEDNLALSTSKDATARKYYEQVYDAEQTTTKLEQELASLHAEIERRASYYDDPVQILDGLKDKYPTLKKLDESRLSGDLLSTTRSVDYRWEDIEALVKERCAASADLAHDNDYVQSISDALEFTTPSVESQDAIVGARNTAISSAAGSIISSGTKEEQMVFQFARSADFATSVDRISDAVLNGSADAQSAYKIIRASADTLAGKKYLRALRTTKDYEAKATRLEQAQQELDVLNADDNADAREVRRLESEIEDLSVKLTDGQTAYGEAADIVAEVEESYTLADRYAQSEGLDADGSMSAKNLLDYVYQYGAQWQRHNWTAQTMYDEALAEGYTYDEVAAAAKTGAEEIKQAIAEIDYVTEQMYARGLVNVEAEEYMINMEHQRERLVRSLKDAEYFQLQGSEDFSSVVEDTKTKVANAWDGAWFLTSMIKYGGYSKVAADIVSSINDPMGTDNMFVLQMTEAEKNTYLYLLGKDGDEAAQAYYDHLTNNEYGVLQTRTAQKEQAIYQELADEGFLGGAAVTAISILSSPVQILGTGYSLYAYAKGDDINPNSQMFAGVRAVESRQDVKDNITEYYGEGSIGAFLANLGYDALTSSADSILAAAVGGSANTALALQSLGGSAGSIKSTIESGGSDAQALMMGGATALAEAVTEKLPMDQLFRLDDFTPKNVKELAGYALTSMGLEGLGEGASDLISNGFEMAIMKEKSNYEQLVEQYKIEEGMDEDTAREQARWDIVKGALYSALVGAVSGSISAVSAGAVKMRQGQQTETSQPESKPVAKHAETDTVLGRQLAALSQAETADVSSGTATIAAVLTPQEADYSTKALASTAAQHIVQKHGVIKSANVMRGIAMMAAENKIDMQHVATGVAVATLGNGKSAVVLDRIVQEGATAENLGNLIVAAEMDMQDPEVGKALQKTVTENQIAQRMKEIIADGGLSGIQSYESAAAQARENLRVAQEKLQTATDECVAAGQNLQSVQAQWVADPTNASLQGSVQQAVKDVEGKSIVMRQYEEGAANFEAKLQEAEKMLTAQREQALKGIREQAQQDVLAMQEQDAQQRQERAEAMDLERQYGNIEAINAENYIDERHADADDAQREEVRDAFAKTAVGFTPEMRENFQSGVEFAVALKKRFGLTDIEFVDDATDQSEGWYNHETGVIRINRGATQGEILKRVLLHELTHRAERGGDAYNQMAQELLGIEYGDDTARMEADIASIMNQYNDFYARNGSDYRMTREAAMQEMVANINAKILEGDADLINRLIAEKPSLARRILDKIKQFINKLRGVKDPEIDQLHRVVQLFEQALDHVSENQQSFMRSDAHPGANQYSIAQLAEALGYKLDTNTEGIPYRMVDQNGNEVTKVEPEQMINTPMGALVRAALRAGTINQEIADAQMKMFADLASLAAQYKDQAMIWEIAGAELFSAIKNNSDKQYSTTVDYGTICAKTQAIVDVMSQTMAKLGRGLTRDEVLDVYYSTANADLSVPCPVCYVFSRWMGVPSLLNNMARYQRRFSDMSIDQITEYVDNVEARYANGTQSVSKAVASARTKLQNKMASAVKRLQKAHDAGKPTQKIVDQLRKLEAEYADVEAYNWVTQVMCKQERDGRNVVQMRTPDGKLIRNEDYRPVPEEILFDLNRTGEFAQYAASWRYRTTRGAGMGKAILPYSGASIGDTMNNQQVRWGVDENPFVVGDEKRADSVTASTIKRMRAQNLIGGQRFQSTSDYRPEWGLDYLMTFLEMQAVGAKGQLYTKVIEAVDMFATAGIEVNLSIMPKGNGYHLDENGKPTLGVEDFSSVTGIDFSQALEKVKKYDNVQMILVGINDTHIRLAMADDRIGFIIPWHSSGSSKTTLGQLMSAVGEQLDNGVDYTDSQTDGNVKNPTQAQKDAWDVRLRLLTGKLKDGLSEADEAIINGNPYLKDLYNRFYVDESADETYGVSLTKDQASQIFPYEYWDTSLTRDQADENGRRFAEYCESIGKTPRFPQFAGEPGYWKLLIDRSMYNNDGSYHHPSTIDVTKIDVKNDVASSVSVAKYGDQRKTGMAVEEAIERINAKTEVTPDIEKVQFSLKDIDLYDEESHNHNGGATVKYALPSPGVLAGDIASWRAGQNTPPPTGAEPSQPQPGGRERQFASQTLQQSRAMPDWLKADLMANADQRFYTPDSNNDQIMRSWERFQTEGYEAMRDRLLQQEGHLLTADDVADANTVMAWANRVGDAWTLLTMAQHYNVEGTREGQALQARKIFSRMTPAGTRAFVAGQSERMLAEHIQTHQQQRERIRRRALERAQRVQDRQAGDEVRRLMERKRFNASEIDPRWGIPINDQQRALIDEYDLGNVRRPGIYYNRATTRQRMLEAILATPNPLEMTGNGLNLIERLEYLSDGNAVITNADIRYIGDQLSQYTYMNDDDQEGRLGSLALARAYEAFGNITPASRRDKARTWRYTGMLLSVPSALRNVIGNAGQNVMNAAAHGVAAELDRIVSHVTGERTTEHLSIADRVRGWEGFVQETGDTFRDYFTDRAVTERAENNRFNTNRRGRVYQTQALEVMRLTEGFLMSVGDRNFWRKAYLNSMAEQMRVAELNGTELNFEEARAQAEADANYSTFSEDGPVRRAFSMLKNVPVLGDVLDFIMPFTGVPTNIVKRMWQFSPAGLASSALRHAYRGIAGEDFLQRDFVNSMARGLTGTAMFAIGMALREMGLIELGTGDDEDKKVYGVEGAQGQQYSPFIRVGNEYVSLSPFAPAASPIIMGATAFDLFQNDDDTLSALYNSCLAGLDQIFDASYMSSLQEALQGYGSPSENIGTAILNSAVSQNVPSVLSQMAVAMDDYVRDTKDKNVIMQALKSGLFQKLPWIREMLPEKVDVAGRSVESKEGLRNFVDPFTTTEAIDDPALDELMRLHEALGTSTHMPSDALSGTKTSLTGVAAEVDGKDKEVYKKRYGELWRLGGDTFDKNGQPVSITGVTDLIQTEAYKAMTDQEKANAISGIVADAKAGATYEAGQRLGHEVKEEKPDTYEKTAVRAMPARFAQSESPMIKKLSELYQRTGDGAFIPKGIGSSFTKNGTQYNLDGENYELLWKIYEEKLEGKLLDIDWSASDEEIAAAVSSAYSSAATSAKTTYVKLHNEP